MAFRVSNFSSQLSTLDLPSLANLPIKSNLIYTNGLWTYGQDTDDTIKITAGDLDNLWTLELPTTKISTTVILDSSGKENDIKWYIPDDYDPNTLSKTGKTFSGKCIRMLPDFHFTAPELVQQEIMYKYSFWMSSGMSTYSGDGVFSLTTKFPIPYNNSTGTGEVPVGTQFVRRVVLHSIDKMNTLENYWYDFTGLNQTIDTLYDPNYDWYKEINISDGVRRNGLPNPDYQLS